MDAINTHDGAAPTPETANPRADAGVVFLVGMLLAGAFTVGATLVVADGPAEARTTPAAVSTR